MGRALVRMARSREAGSAVRRADVVEASRVLGRRSPYARIGDRRATTAMFSVVYGVLLKPLPFDEPDRLVALYHRAPGFNTPTLPQSDATYFTYRLYLSGVESTSTTRPPRLWIGRFVCLRCSSFVNAAICARDISIGTFSTYQVMPSVQGGVVSEPA